MPTPLQPLQPLPQQQARSAAGSNSMAPSGRGYGENAAVRMKRGAPGMNPPLVRAQAQEIPISAGRNLLKKQKEHKIMDKETANEVKEIEKWEKERERDRSRGREQERERNEEAARPRPRGRSASMSVPPSHAANTAVFKPRVVVPIASTPSKSNGGSGWGFGLFSSGGDKAKEKEKEKAREKEREREREREKGKKLSKRR